MVSSLLARKPNYEKFSLLRCWNRAFSSRLHSARRLRDPTLRLPKGRKRPFWAFLFFVPSLATWAGGESALGPRGASQAIVWEL